MNKVLCFLWFCGFSTVFAQAVIHYEVSFGAANSHEAFIQITFDSLSKSPLELRMSRTSPGRYALHEFAKNIYQVEAFDATGKKLHIKRVSPHQWNVFHQGFVRVRYTLFANRVDGTYSAIDSTHAHLNAPATFMWASGFEHHPIELKINLPEKKNWKVATQLQNTQHTTVFKAPHLQYFMDSPIEISDFVLTEWELPGTKYKIRFALHHQGTSEENALYCQMIQSVILEEIAIFQEAPAFDFGTYTFIADYLPYAFGDGMEHRNSTILTSSRDLKYHPVRLLSTLAHEFFHSWNVERLRPKSLEPFKFEEENFTRDLWFGEGFTSYYDDLVLYRTRLVSLEYYARALSYPINKVLLSPGKAVFSAAQMSEYAPFVDCASFIDPQNLENIFISYYSYGSAIALGLDLTLRSQFDLSLDNFMREAWLRFGKTEKPYTEEDLKLLLGEFTKDSEFASHFFQNYIHGKKAFPYKSLLAQAGLLLRKKNPEKAYLGKIKLSYKKKKALLQSYPHKGSPLYQAGLDREDTLLKIKGQKINHPKDFDFILKDSRPGEQVLIEFIHRGKRYKKQITFVEDPTLEVVPYEKASLLVTPAMHKFRERWLGNRSGILLSHLKKQCSTCQRKFKLEEEICFYDKTWLEIVTTIE